MRDIGFSTGALCRGDFRSAMALVCQARLPAVELSALREDELPPLLDNLEMIDLSGYRYISVHAPSAYADEQESYVVSTLIPAIQRNFPVIVHPDAISRFYHWRGFGNLLCIENMDKRKPIGRTADELDNVFQQLPDASLCFDIGHARQVDPTMSVAAEILNRFADRLVQVHISDVNSRSRHERLNVAAIHAFSKVAHLIPEHIPLILETPLFDSGPQASRDIAVEIELAKRLFAAEPAVAA
jgi:hypothetical protein